MRKIKCNQCDEILFETDKESDGAAGSQAQNMGFVFKMPFLFTDKYGCLFFCDKDCCKVFYDNNIPKNKEVSDHLVELKKDIPRMAKETCNRLQELRDKIKLN